MASTEQLDRELLLEQMAAAALRGELALLTGNEEEVGVLLGEVAMSLVDDTEVARLDACSEHTAGALIRSLVVSLDVVPDHLVSTLRQRAETLPLVLVVESAECLSSEALKGLKTLLEKSRGGLGAILGGEPELPELLEDADLHPAWRGEAAGLAPTPPREETSRAPALPQWLPWRHLAAVLGLLVLVWIFWPGEQAPQQARELALPQPSAEPATGDDESPAAAPGDQDTDGAAAQTSIASEPLPQSAPAPESTDPQPERAPSAPQPEPEPAPEQEPAPAPEPEPVSRPEPSPPEDSGAGRKDEPLTGLDAQLGYAREDWLMTRDPGSWYLQLILAADEDRARRELDHLGRDRGAYYRAQRQDRAVYVVVAGPYSSREEALGARSSLPARFRDAGPFPRSHESVVADIGN
jgi:DamX protein